MCVCVKKSAGKVITNLPLKTTGTFCFKWQHKQQNFSLITNIPFHGFRRHLDLGANKTWLLCNAPYISFQNKTQFATLKQVLAFFCEQTLISIAKTFCQQRRDIITGEWSIVWAKYILFFGLNTNMTYDRYGQVEHLRNSTFRDLSGQF